MTKSPTCKHCEAPISFEKRDGRWVPLDPGTNRRHVCKLDLICDECGAEFQGAPWMKLCRDCFNINHPNRRGFKPPAQHDQPKREPEPLRYDDDDQPEFPF